MDKSGDFMWLSCFMWLSGLCGEKWGKVVKNAEKWGSVGKSGGKW